MLSSLKKVGLSIELHALQGYDIYLNKYDKELQHTFFQLHSVWVNTNTYGRTSVCFGTSKSFTNGKIHKTIVTLTFYYIAENLNTFFLLF